MSHELRTPLNAIIGFSEMLQQRYFGALNDKQAEYVDDVLASGRHLLLLINDILDLSKVEHGLFEVDAQPFDLAQVVEGAMLLVRYRAAQSGLKLGVEIPDGIGVVRADERMVKQVLINLLSNALKFAPRGGSVTLGAQRVGGELSVWVQDTGIGIAKAEQALISDAFGQAKPAVDKREGTGLGLTLSRRFIELHGGRLSLLSAPGQGARFTFTLPHAYRSAGDSP